MLNFISIISNTTHNQIDNLDGFRFLPDESDYERYKFISESAGFWITGDKSEIKKQVYEDDNFLVILCGYVLFDSLDYNSNLAKQIFDFFRLKKADLFKGLSGAFNVIVYEKNDRKLLISNDRLGIKALYYYKSNNKLICASDIKPIIFSNQIKKEINWRAWGDIFNYGFIIGDKTPFENVMSLPMASILTHQNGNFELKKYWTFNDIQINYEQNEKEIINNGIEILKSLSHKYERLINSAIVPLSGGYDSRCIACCLKYFSNINFETITSDLHASGHKDIVMAEQVSKLLRVKHTKTSDENLYKKYFINMVFQVNGMTYEHLWAMSLRNRLGNNLISLDGMIIDVLLGPIGYLPERDSDDKIYQKYTITEIFNNYFQSESIIIKKFFDEKIIEHSRNRQDELLNQISDLKNYLFTFLYINNKTRNSISTGSNSIIGYNKKTMFFFYYNELIEYSFSIPPYLKSRKDIYRKILKKAFPSIMSVPTTHDLNLLKLVIRILKKLKVIKEIRLKKLIKSNRLNKISAFPINSEDKKYLIKLIQKLEAPTELYKDTLLKEIERRDSSNNKSDCIIVPLANFLVWYNLFYLAKSPDELKSLSSN